MMRVGIAVCFLVFLSACTSEAGQSPRNPINIQNKEHIKEHMSEYYKEGDIEDNVDLNSYEAVQFHFFKLHDTDNNGKLDGLELYTAIRHYNVHGELGDDTMTHEKVVGYVDKMLKEDDLNEDGYVDYYEFYLLTQPD